MQSTVVHRRRKKMESGETKKTDKKETKKRVCARSANNRRRRLGGLVEQRGNGGGVDVRLALKRLDQRCDGVGRRGAWHDHRDGRVLERELVAARQPFFVFVCLGGGS